MVTPSIRLLYLTPEPCPTFRADVHTLFGKYLPREGVSSDLIAIRSDKHDENTKWEGGQAFLNSKPHTGIKRQIYTFLHGIKQLFIADHDKYDAIQVRDMPFLALIGLIVARWKGLPFYYWMSFPIPEGHMALAKDRGLSCGLIKYVGHYIQGVLGKRVLYKWVFSKADHIFVQSDQMREDVSKLGIDPEIMTPVPMGVDFENTRIDNIPTRKELPTNDKPVLVYLGALDRVRKIEVLFEMLKILKEHYPNILLILVGDTNDKPHKSWLKTHAAELEISENILWTDWLPIEEAWQYVRTGDIALSPIPRSDLFDCSSPTKTPEYLALSIPVVCSDNPDQKLIIENCGGGICTQYDAQNFSKAILKLYKMSKEERDAMAHKGHTYIKNNRSYELIAYNLANSYKNLLNKKTRSTKEYAENI